MTNTKRLTTIAACLTMLGLAGCAGTPTDPTSKVASTRKCEKSIGSMICDQDGDQSRGNINDPALTSLPSAGAASGR